MRIGLAYDLKTEVSSATLADDALEEYDSPETLAIIAAALEEKGHEIYYLGGGEQFLDNVRREPMDFVFNIAEGRGSHRSREAQVPAVLEMLDIPYTGSDPLTLAVCLDKPLAKQLAADAGIATPRWLVVTDHETQNLAALDGFSFPVIIKPASEGSSKGIRATAVADSLHQAVSEIRRQLDTYYQPVMVEEFVDGDEVTVGIIGNQPAKVVGVMRVLPKESEGRFIYSVDVKRDYLALVDYECPARLCPEVLRKIEEMSLGVFRALGCRDFARVDFRIRADGKPFFIEINPLPGLGTYSDLVIMALKMGWTHHRLIGAVLKAALKRCPQCLRI